MAQDPDYRDVQTLRKRAVDGKAEAERAQQMAQQQWEMPPTPSPPRREESRPMPPPGYSQSPKSSEEQSGTIRDLSRRKKLFLGAGTLLIAVSLCGFTILGWSMSNKDDPTKTPALANTTQPTSTASQPKETAPASAATSTPVPTSAHGAIVSVVVKPEEGIYQLCRRYCPGRWPYNDVFPSLERYAQEVMQLNSLTYPIRLSPGQKLLMPPCPLTTTTPTIEAQATDTVPAGSATSTSPPTATPTNTPPLPDRDGDGVLDWQDRCAGQPGVPEFDGCPDDDGDGFPEAGFPDKQDQCPGEPGTVNGCPDSDGDGIPDKDDGCPNQWGPPENAGCPRDD
jgi:hypothetical protein